MEVRINMKEAIERTFNYLIKTTSVVERENLRLTLAIATPRRSVQVITPESFKSIGDLHCDYITNRICHWFYTRAQFELAWEITAVQHKPPIRFILDGGSSRTIR